MTDDTMQAGEQTARPMRLLPRRLAARLDERHLPATPALKRVFDELLRRPARRWVLRRKLAASRKILLPGITVLVPTRDRAGALLANLLASLEGQSARREMRVMVIDYGSREDEAREIAGLAAATGWTNEKC